MTELERRDFGHACETVIREFLLEVLDDMGQYGAEPAAGEPMPGSRRGIAQHCHEGDQYGAAESDDIRIALVLACVVSQQLRAGVQPVISKHQARRRASNHLEVLRSEAAGLLRIESEDDELRLPQPRGVQGDGLGRREEGQMTGSEILALGIRIRSNTQFGPAANLLPQ